MNNQELAKIFYEIAEYLKMDDIPFKPYAYQRAAMALESLEEDIKDVYERGGLRELEDMKAIGKSIALKIEEYLKTKRIKYYDGLKKKLPLNLGELTQVEGMGSRKARMLYRELGVKDLKTLEKAAKSHKISSLPGFGEKSEQNILEGLEFLKRSRGRYLLGEILPEVKSIIKRLESLKEVEQISPAGSVRRRKDTIGDVDILVTTKNAKKVMDFFLSFPEIVRVWGKGSTKTSVRLRQGFDVDLRVLRKGSYGSALQYFTGSKEHNIAVRRIAMQEGLKLSEYGLFRGSKMIAGLSEQGVYRALGMDFIEPELREDRGEISAAILHNLPRLIEYNEIKGDLHCHTNQSDGENTIEEMVQAAKKLGYEYIGISDHTKFLRITNGLDEKRLEKRIKEIDKLNGKEKNFRILKGAEVNILNDGSLDIKDETLQKLDYVIAGIHTNFKMEREEMTKRIIRAIKNPNVDIISHPTGRILKRRDEYNCDFDEILKVAKEYNVALEINSNMHRMDLNDQNIKKAKDAGVKMIINTDSHSTEGLRDMEMGISQARRGWAEKEDIINTNSLKKLLTYFH